MSDIEPYVRTLLLQYLKKEFFPSGYFRQEEITGGLADLIGECLDKYGARYKVDIIPIAETFFSDFLAYSVVSEIADPFAGNYYRINPESLSSYRAAMLNGDEVAARATAIGSERYFTDVFSGYSGGETQLPWGGGISVPASDRVVSIGHNQRNEITQPLDHLIHDVQGDNEPLDDGVKERILGQLRAGGELVKSGSVRAYLLYHTLVRGLMELVARYRGRAIAVAAEKLIELLVENFFKSSDS